VGTATGLQTWCKNWVARTKPRAQTPAWGARNQRTGKSAPISPVPGFAGMKKSLHNHGITE